MLALIAALLKRCVVVPLSEVNADVDCGTPPKVLVSEDWVVADAAGRNRLEANNPKQVSGWLTAAGPSKSPT